MSTRRFLYKCRRCGKVDDSTCTGNKLAYQILVHVVATHGVTPTPPAQQYFGAPVTMLSLCNCADGGYGVSDLIGMSPEGDLPLQQKPQQDPAGS